MITEVNSKKPWLVNDLVISEENCNLSCTYCLTDSSLFKEKHLDHPLRKPPVVLNYHDEKLNYQLNKVIENINEEFEVSILKVSGGEVFLIKNVMEFLEKQAKHHTMLQILTNGFGLTEKILSSFKEWGNVCLQISIDHHTLEGNGHRLSSKTLQDTLLKKIELVVQYNIPLEIYCVINDKNADVLEDFVAYLNRYAGKVMIFPFPVRGPMRDYFFPNENQVLGIQRVLDNYESYASVLPPRPYLERLMSMFSKEGRTFRCHLPRLVFSTFNDGTLTACPNIWFNNLGNLIDSEYQVVTNKVKNTPFYELLLSEKPRLDACKKCFTPWDMLSMYFDGLICLDELCKSPMYMHPDIRSKIELIYSQYQNEND
ncbi:radical SAM protein [Bacillus cereus]|uniref:radical SAM protein n=1 Tax=Bacillus cereus TaxID=1396 RepID=UPI00065B7048|nr:radical SAM protein [Bacillus cereus]KMQ32171.1 hypothetical protein TU58_01405 [Bacillus cereus]